MSPQLPPVTRSRLGRPIPATIATIAPLLLHSHSRLAFTESAMLPAMSAPTAIYSLPPLSAASAHSVHTRLQVSEAPSFSDTRTICALIRCLPTARRSPVVAVCSPPSRALRPIVSLILNGVRLILAGPAQTTGRLCSTRTTQASLTSSMR
jgi:hypothetical protein